MADDTQQLAALIAKKHQIVLEIMAIAKQQQSAVEEQKVSELIPLLSQKQQMLGGLLSLQKELEPFASQNPESRVWVSQAARIQCREQSDQCDQMLKEILKIDTDSEQLLLVRREEMAEHLQQSTGAMNAVKAYQSSQNPSSPANSRLDLSSE